MIQQLNLRDIIWHLILKEQSFQRKCQLHQNHLQEIHKIRHFFHLQVVKETSKSFQNTPYFQHPNLAIINFFSRKKNLNPKSEK